MSYLYHLLISQPLYNGLILLMRLLPFFDAGVVVIIFTVIVKIILLPLSIKASKTQIKMNSVQKDLNAIKEKYKDSKEEQSKKTLEYYKEHNINPFAGFFILLIQLPIIIGLYRIFLKSGLPQINTSFLYSFVSAPLVINMNFLNLINISQKSLVLAVIAGITTYFQISLANKSQESSSTSGQSNIQADFARAMSINMKYFFPVLVVFISWSISAALSLYWITNNLFAIGQEIYIKNKYHKKPPIVI